MKKIARFTPLILVGLLSTTVLLAQGLDRDNVPLKNWDAPMYWQPSVVESKDAAAKQLLAGNVGGDRASSITAQAQTPANSLVFVGMTPCRVVDTRGGTGTFGGPALIGGTNRTFPIPSSATCSIPSIAQAYSFNITIVPPGFLDFITVWPTGQPQPLASTLNGYVNTVIANAAIVPAGTGGAVDVYASQNTHLIIDINGYYAAQSGITLTQGTAGAPSLSFSGDPGTGIFSTGGGTLNIATGGMSRLSVASNGDVNATNNLDVSGSLRAFGTGNNFGLYGQTDLSNGNAVIGFANVSVQNGRGVFGEAAGPDGIGVYGHAAGSSPGTIGVRGLSDSATGIGVAGVGNSYGVQGLTTTGAGVGGSATGNSGVGVLGIGSGSSSGTGVRGSGTTYGLEGFSTGGVGVYGSTSTGWAGYFNGNVHASGNVGVGTSLPTNRLDVRRADNNGGDVVSFGSPTYNMGRLGEDTASNKVYIANVYPSDSSFLDFRLKGNASTDSKMVIQGNGNVGIGLTSPTRRLQVEGGSTEAIYAHAVSGIALHARSEQNLAGYFEGFVEFTNLVFLDTLGSAGSTQLCRNGANQVSSCSSSLRYKTDVQTFPGGLGIINRLRPISFDWKETGAHDIGLGAEEVERVEPLLIFRNEKGEVEGVKYNQLSAVFINAFKEQQAQIEDQAKRITDQQDRITEQHEQLEQQRRQIDNLKELVCFDHPQAAVCK